MARFHLALLTASVLLASCSSQESAVPAQQSTTEVSRAAVTDYARLLMVEHKPEDAFGKYYADLLIQHDPWIGDGGKGDAEFLRQRREAEPDKYGATEQYISVIHNILADGDLVVLKSHVFTSPTDKGREFVDIWRLEDGKFAEHWDVIQPITPEMVATVGCGFGGTYEAAVKAGDTAAKPVCGLSDPKGNSAANKDAAIAYLQAKAGAETGRIERVAADGDLVLVHRLVTGGSAKFSVANADLMRVKDGKVVNHWNVTQPIPEFSASGRSMTGGVNTPLEPGRVKRTARAGE